MNKEKAKNITLGVSLILNLLGSLLIGGSLIHACNSPASLENADLSPSTLSIGKKDALRPRMAESGLNGTTWTFASDLDGVEEGNVELSFTSNGIACNILYAFYEYDGLEFYYVPTATGDDFRVYAQASGGWENEAYRTITLTAEPSSDALTFLQTWADVSTPATSSETSSSDVSSSSGEGASSSATSLDQPIYDVVKVPVNFWGYRVFNGSFDSNTGGVFVANEIADTWSGGVRLTRPRFTLGDNPKVYNGIEFYFWNFYGRDFVNEEGEITRASSNGFKQVLYLDHISVHPDDGSSYDDGSSWFVIGSAIYGMNGEGSLYVNAHGFNWLDASYKEFRVQRMDADALPYLAYTGSASSSFVNPIIKGGLTIAEAFRLALTGTSADVSGGVTIGGNGYTDVFALIGSAFSSLVPILSVQVLPYLTIGTLMLVPLIVLVIFAILKVLNK